MAHRPTPAAVLALACLTAGCSYDLSMVGKYCDADRPCPQGYFCVPEGDVSVCARQDVDGGVPDADGADGTDGNDQDQCQQGQIRCGEDLSTLQTCIDGSWQSEDCDQDQYCDPVDPDCKDYCDDDRDCADRPGTTCEPNSRKCVQLNICKADADCPAGQECVEQAGACVAVPAEQGELSGGGQPALDCYEDDPTSPPDDPTSCSLQGQVVNFFYGQALQETIGLTVRIHRLDDVLDGVLDSPISSTVAIDDNGLGQYELNDVPNNAQLVLEVQGRTEGDPFATMFTFGIYLRADDCADAGNTILLAAPAIFQANYDAYSNPDVVVSDPDKGLLFGKLLDCDGAKIMHGTGGLSMEHELLYYLSSGIPDPDATGTDSSGLFVAANVSPIRGVASALVLSGAEPVSLWHKPVRVFTGAASLVLFERPPAPRQ